MLILLGHGDARDRRFLRQLRMCENSWYLVYLLNGRRHDS